MVPLPAESSQQQRGRRPRAAVLAAAVAAAVVVAPVTWSHGALAPQVAHADEKAEAQKLLTEGNQAAGDGDYLLALQKFQAAYALYKSPKILLNIGTMLRQLGRNVEAASVYEAYAQDPGADPARVRDVQRILGEMGAILGRLRIQVNRPDAHIRLDGRELSGFTNGMVLRVEPGEHTVVASLPPLAPDVATLQIGPREERLIELRVLPPEERTRIVERVFTGPQRTIGVVLGSIGLGGLAAGVVAGTLAAVKNHAAAAHCRQNISCDAEGVSLGNTAKASAVASTAALAAGGGLLATGIILFFTAPRRPRGELVTPSRVTAAVSPTGASLGWEVSF